MSEVDANACLPYVEIGEFVFAVQPHGEVAPGSVGLNTVQRKILRVSVGDVVKWSRYEPPSREFDCAGMTIELECNKPATAAALVQTNQHRQVHADEFTTVLRRTFSSQVFSIGQKAPVDYAGETYLITINHIVVEGAREGVQSLRGMFTPATTVVYEATSNSGIKVQGQKAAVMNTGLFKNKDFSFSKLGIGGLDRQFEDIFRRAFSSRVFPQSVVERLGIKHVKGMLLHGPPGTGKTLIARQIGKMLNGKEPVIVNGPEVMSKYVGQSEENIRNLFVDAETEYKARGDDSDLHIFIFDEIDALCKSRGSVTSGTGVHDSIVNQLLTKIDGVDALNNILLIGMTNRKDMLDEAMLRPGRLEVHIEIGLPDEKGRIQILNIHSNRMSENEFLGADVDLAELARRTGNFSGAEIEGLVKSAVSFALMRQVDMNDIGAPIDEENIKVTMADFEKALLEVKPAFGASTTLFERCMLNGMYSHGETHEKLVSTMESLIEQVRVSEKTPMLTCLLEGGAGTGKTALSAALAIKSQFPFTKLFSPDTFVGAPEAKKCADLAKLFDDAYKSPVSLIVLDDIERLLEYVDVGPRFSNVILQALLVLLKRQPPPGRKLFVIGTTSFSQDILKRMGLDSAFNVCLHVPALNPDETTSVLTQLDAFAPDVLPRAYQALEAFAGSQIPIKRLFMLLEMARHGQTDHDDSMDVGSSGPVSLDRWVECLRDLSA